MESVCNASIISEKVPWEHKWLHETGGQRRRGDNIEQRPEATVQNTICQPDQAKPNTWTPKLCAFSSFKLRSEMVPQRVFYARIYPPPLPPKKMARFRFLHFYCTVKWTVMYLPAT